VKIVTFEDIDISGFDSKHDVVYFGSRDVLDAKVAILGISTIFEYEENKHNVCDQKFVSIAIIDDKEDYSAFKNFGIDAWIKREDISEINGLINLLEKRFLS
jgi:hypothetical protein